MNMQLVRGRLAHAHLLSILLLNLMVNSFILLVDAYVLVILVKDYSIRHYFTLIHFLLFH